MSALLVGGRPIIPGSVPLERTTYTMLSGNTPKMLNAPDTVASLRPLPRLLPKDDKLLLALADCQRDLGNAQAALLQFHENWFQKDPPQRGDARDAAAELESAAVNLRNSARNLLYLTDPNPK